MAKKLILKELKNKNKNCDGCSGKADAKIKTVKRGIIRKGYICLQCYSKLVKEVLSDDK